jgi:hypothetical protein
MILNTAIILIIVGYVAYLILTITRAGAAGKKKRALANLEKLYQLYNSRKKGLS